MRVYPRVCCSLFPQRKESGGRKKQDQSKAIEDQHGQTYTRHHWTQATDATPVMFVTTTKLNIFSHFAATDHSPDLVQKLVLKSHMSGVVLKVHVVGFIADVIECNQFVLFWFIKLICWIEGL